MVVYHKYISTQVPAELNHLQTNSRDHDYKSTTSRRISKASWVMLKTATTHDVTIKNIWKQRHIRRWIYNVLIYITLLTRVLLNKLSNFRTKSQSRQISQNYELLTCMLEKGAVNGLFVVFLSICCIVDYKSLFSRHLNSYNDSDPNAYSDYYPVLF